VRRSRIWLKQRLKQEKWEHQGIWWDNHMYMFVE
jgi:hypothetical protein